MYAITPIQALRKKKTSFKSLTKYYSLTSSEEKSEAINHSRQQQGNFDLFSKGTALIEPA